MGSGEDERASKRIDERGHQRSVGWDEGVEGESVAAVRNEPEVSSTLLDSYDCR